MPAVVAAPVNAPTNVVARTLPKVLIVITSLATDTLLANANSALLVSQPINASTA